jgi:hypothetical protein
LFKELHGASTLGTENRLGPRFKRVRGVVVGSAIGEWVVGCRGHSQRSFDLLESPRLRVEEAIVAHLLEAVRQDML